MPTDLSRVLNELPRPELNAQHYPNWKPADWEAQLRFAAGEPVGEDFGFLSGPPSGRSPQKEREAPNKKGEQLGGGPLSFRAGCWNLTSVFSHQRFVVPMLEKIRRESLERFYSASPEQMVKPNAKPQSQ
jgi:hypothetical protein